jgi:2-iminobutanoate/2-iminopropanoate deaminase
MNFRLLPLLIACVGLNACAFVIKADVDGHPSSAAVYHPFMVGEETPYPFSEAVESGDLIFLSGQLGMVPGTTDFVPGGIGPQTRQTLENIEATLIRLGADRYDIVKCTIFLADMAEWPAMNVVYSEFFGEPFPARSAVGVSGLAMGARLEIECIAAKPSRHKQ